MVRARKYVAINQFKGEPKREDYKIVEYELPALKNGEILVKAEWLSVDPYLRIVNSMRPVPYDQFGYQVATVVQTKDANYPVGTKVVSHTGWCDYTILSTNNKGKSIQESVYKLPDLGGLSPSLGIGAVGMPGASAYLGNGEALEEEEEICKPKAGETVVVTGAAGAVGSIVGQIAKIKGCKAIGFAGSDDKVKWLENELGFDKAFNYKTVDVIKALKEAAPNGIDCYFDNVGGQISSQIMSQMNSKGRVCVCGSISVYNDGFNFDELPKATILQPTVLMHELKVEGFIINSWGFDRWEEAFAHILDWIKSGQLKANERVTEGFDNVFDAFIDMLAGKNYGKAVVKV